MHLIPLLLVNITDKIVFTIINVIIISNNNYLLNTENLVRFQLFFMTIIHSSLRFQFYCLMIDLLHFYPSLTFVT